jgi:kumamolisin
MAFEKRIALAGSERSPYLGSQPVGAIQDQEVVQATIILRPKQSFSPAAQPLTREEFSSRGGAHDSDIALVERFAHEFHLTVVEASVPKRRIILSGTAAAMSQAFGTNLSQYRIEATGHSFRGRTGALSIPTELKDTVIAVLGLDSRPVANAKFITLQRAATQSYTPPQVASLYNFPTAVNGAGQTVGIIELGGGYVTADLTAYFNQLNIPQPNVTAVSVDGGTNSPGSDADGEVMLDIEVVGSMAPGANIAVYFAPNTDQGFIDAITDAVHDTTRKPSVISISWGASEDSWTSQSRNAMNAALQDAAALGVTVTVACGDNGSTDGQGDRQLHVDFPSSSPYALACGGTMLRSSGTSISSEVVWNEIANGEGATGGGVSNAFPLPSYQSAGGVPKQPQTNYVGRGVPDVSGNADPTTGYQVRVNGQNQIIGGTSAVAPLWAALVALMNQQLGSPAGFLQPKIYPLGESAFRDISTGNNDDANLGYYSAKSGWDPCTGLGSPNGTALGNALGGGSSVSARTILPGSAPQLTGNESWSAVPNISQETLTATILVRRRDAVAAGAMAQALLSGEPVGAAAQQAMEADPKDIDAVLAFAKGCGLKIVEHNAASRTVKASGTVGQMNRAFGVHLEHTNDRGQRYLSYRGELSVPNSLASVITAVLGLDQRPSAKHH